MNKKKLTKRQKAIIRRNLFLSFCAVILAVIIFLTVTVVKSIKGNSGKDTSGKKDIVANESVEKQPKKITFSEAYEPADIGGKTFDANYTRLLVVNEENPLPEDYNYGANTVQIAKKYLNGGNNRFDEGAYPYLVAMIEAAWRDNVKLYVWSPYRSYNDQQMVFENNVKSVMKEKGLNKTDAEKEVRKTVLYPGTSEHHTGLCADFNMADDRFSDTEMFTWLCNNAANYGFILRYPSDKEDITSVDYESWHWRFVGINRAKEINSLGLCLEEFCQRAEIDNNSELLKE